MGGDQKQRVGFPGIEVETYGDTPTFDTSNCDTYAGVMLGLRLRFQGLQKHSCVARLFLVITPEPNPNPDSKSRL